MAAWLFIFLHSLTITAQFRFFRRMSAGQEQPGGDSIMTISARRGLKFGTVALALVWGDGAALGQTDQSRRELATPGLILETGNRTSACDVLTFTNKGQFLFATGDDKVVRTWKFTGQGLEPISDPAPAGVPQAVLRWPSHRERRGN